MQFGIIDSIVDGGIYFKIDTNRPSAMKMPILHSLFATSIEELKSGSRCREVSGVRALIAIGLVKKHGVALAEVARRVGVSTAAVSKIIKRARQ